MNTSDSRLTDARTPLAHVHGNITNTGAIGTTSGLVVTTTTGGVLTTSSRSGIDTRSTFPPSSHALNSHTACTLAQINALITDATLIDTSDTRLSDARPASDVSAWAKASTKPSYTYSEVGAAASSHTHNYAGSSSAGGAATSANKLNTNAGSVTQPVYFANGVPVATTYSLGKSVPSNAVFTDTTYSNMVGATTSVAGTAGLVPAPSAGAATRYLRSDGTWQVPPDNNTTYTANNGVSLSGTTFSNSGVRSIATGGTNGTISVNTNGTSANVAVKGLGTAAYTASTAYAASSHTHNYAGSSSAGGSATSAKKLDTSTAGDANTPVYFSGGVPISCTSLDLNTSGNAATATKVNNALAITLDSGTTEGTDKFTFDGSITKTVDINAEKIKAIEYMTASETVYVGASETYKTINSALEYLSTKYPAYKSGGISATIMLRSGFVMREQVIVDGVGFGLVRIASEDAEVTIDATYITVPTPEDWYASQYAAFIVVRGGTLPVIGALFTYGTQSAGTAGGIISKSSTVIIEPSCGIKNAKSTGILAINSTVYGKDSNFSGAYGDCAYFGGSCQAFMAGATLSGSVTGNGLTAENASTVNAANTDCSNCGSHSILANRGSVVTANSATLSGSYIGINALQCSTVNADFSVITGITSDNSLYALQSSTINVTAASLSKAVVSDRGSNVNITGTTGATLAQVLFGGFISAYNTSVTLSQ
ncbi:hypothetical protein EOM57_05345, partial [Candidatus Saccharibacteria bacterium]|nr:hypothetical protein [Candidatus Saccharibacteria bacterium]